MNTMGYFFAALACLAIGGLAGYLAALSRRAAMAEEAAQLRSQVAALDAILATERTAQAEKLALLDDARDRMTHQFRALANDIGETAILERLRFRNQSDQLRRFRFTTPERDRPAQDRASPPV